MDQNQTQEQTPELEQNPVPETPKKTFDVTIVRTGYLSVLAKDAAEAMWLADHQTTDTVSWSEDWSPTDAEENPELDPDDCVSEPMFE